MNRGKKYRRDVIMTTLDLLRGKKGILREFPVRGKCAAELLLTLNKLVDDLFSRRWDNDFFHEQSAS